MHRFMWETPISEWDIDNISEKRNSGVCVCVCLEPVLKNRNT